MTPDKKLTADYNIRRFLVLICLIFSISHSFTRAEAAAITSIRSSDSKDAYITVNLDQDKVILEGRTEDDVSSFIYGLYKFVGNTGTGRPLTGKITDGEYKEVLTLPASEGKLEDGRYQILIELTDAKCTPYIIVENRAAHIYRSDSFDIDLTADAFIKTLNRTDLLLSNSENIFNSSPSNLDMTDTQKDEIHKAALTVTEGLKTDYEKVKAIYQWVTENIYYDYASAANTSNNGNNNPYRVYKNRYGVCEGYSRLMVEMLRSLKISSVIVCGAALGAPITKNSGGGHAWVAVYADGRWFYTDPTWDSGNQYKNRTYIKGESTLEYFDVTLEAMSETHRIQDVEAGIDIGDFSVTFYREHISVETYEGKQSEITLPKKVSDLKITQVSSNFIRELNYNVKGIIVPEGYESLMDAAFQRYIRLEYIVLPDTIGSIGENAFLNTKDKVIIYCRNDKVVNRYAENNNIRFNNEIPASLRTSNKTVKKISEAENTAPGKMTYTGSELKPKPSISYHGALLKEGIDYTVSYRNNLLPGNAEVIIKGIGSFEGTKEITFPIVPKKISVKLSSQKAETVQITWKAAIGALGYEIRYSSKPEGPYNLYGRTYSTSYTAQKFTSGKTYYIKVRPYIIINGTKVYGSYSTAAAITVK